MDAVLAGETVAFTGRMASLTRAEATTLVRTRGGGFARTVTATTTLLVIGQDGWPLQSDGAVSRKLQTAHKLIATGSRIKVVTEEEWLRQLDLLGHVDRIHRLLSPAELSQMLDVSRDQLRAWIRAGLISPTQQASGVAYFDFRQATAARTVSDLVRRGVTAERMRQSLDQLRSWMPDAADVIALLERDGRLLVRIRDELLAESTGQLCWDFADGASIVVTFEERPPTAEEWFNRGWSNEQNGRLQDAVHAYRQALIVGQPNAQICFNLANVLNALGRRESAVERYYQAVELEPEFAESWNNLGNVLADLGQSDEAMTAYENAVSLDPAYADPHYNYAELLWQLGRYQKAASHWQKYLRLESAGPWSDYARKRLAAGGWR